MFITSFGEQNITYKCCSNLRSHLYLIASIELHNAYLIDQNLLNQSERLPLLQKYAERLRASLNKSPAMKRLEQQSNTPLLKDIDK